MRRPRLRRAARCSE